MFNLDTGKREEYESGTAGNFLPILRHEPPPCEDCPKGRQDLTGDLKLHWRNIQAVNFYLEIKALGGSGVLPAHLENCSTFYKNMLTIQQIYRDAEAELIEKSRPKESVQDGWDYGADGEGSV